MTENIKAIIFDWGRTIYDKDNEMLFPETLEVLEYCAKKYTLVVVSLATDGDIEGRFKKLDTFGIRKFFQFALFHVADKDSLLRNTVGNLQLDPSEILVVDDRIKRLEWSIKNGLKTVWIKKGKFEHELPDSSTGNPNYTLSSLQELLIII